MNRCAAFLFIKPCFIFCGNAPGSSRGEGEPFLRLSRGIDHSYSPQAGIQQRIAEIPNPIFTRIRCSIQPAKQITTHYAQTPHAGYNPRMIAASLKRKALRVHQKLLEMYGQPTWRKTLPPVDELVCTILSQNTNDVNRDVAFEALRARFDSWEAVRDAPAEVVMQAIRPAGLANQKGPRIQEALRSITAERGSLDLEFLRGLPSAEARAWLTRFKGVGPKTAAIVLQFSLDTPAFPVDTHVYRVTGRLGLRPEKMTVERAHAHLEALFPPETYYAAHLNLIAHGRALCHARKPECEKCDLRRMCDYYKIASGASYRTSAPDAGAGGAR